MFELLSMSMLATVLIGLAAIVLIVVAAIFIFSTRDTLNSKYPHLAQIKTVEMDSEEGPLVIIMASFNFDAPLTDEMVDEAIEVIKCQRMLSPPNTSGLLVTIVGSVTAEQFALGWKKIGAIDEVLQVFISQMKLADVVSASTVGDPSSPETASLIAG